jgi:F-type H+-transporting ATPase subunit delta
MGSTFAIADRYASALFEKAEDAGTTAKIHAELLAVDKMLSSHDGLRRAFLSPVTSRAQLWAVLSDLLAKLNVSPLTRSFFGVLAKNRRMQAFADILARFDAKRRLQQGIQAIDVFVPLNTPEKSRKKIAAGLEKKYGGKAEVRFIEDALLLGGLKIKIGSTLIDQSIDGQLNKLASVLKGD